MPVLATKNRCTGCGACGNICPHQAIEFRKGSDTFLYPEVDPTRCVECRLCEKACPLVNGELDNLKNKTIEKCYAMWSEPDRSKSSSGGAFSAIARIILADGGKVYGAAWGEDNRCQHIGVSSVEDLLRLRGSKYVQSDIGECFKEIRRELTSGRKVLFTGTPCQVGGLKSYLRRTYDNLFTVDIVCHGVPSNHVFQEYLKKLRSEFPQYTPFSQFEFRNLKGWGKSPQTIGRKVHHLTGVANSYMLAFDKGNIVRQCCSDCQFNGLKRVSDITLGDFWGLEDTRFRHDVTKGVSLVLPNSISGEAMLRKLQTKDDVFMEESSLAVAVKNNHNLTQSSAESECRESVIADFVDPTVTLRELSRRYRLVDNRLTARVKRLLIRTNLFFPTKNIYNKLRRWI